MTDLRMFLMPDGEDAGAGIDNLIAPETETKEEVKEEVKENKPELPAWTSQLPKDLRDNADIMGRISGYKTIADLANAYVKSEDAGKDALHVPGKDSTEEERRAFFTKLGVPEKASDYNLSDYDLDPETLKKSKDIFMEAAHRSALSRRQAENLWMSEVAMFKAASELKATAEAKTKASFEPQYHKILEAEYPEQTEREKVIKGELGAVTKLAQELGIGKALADSGLIYDAEVMHKLAGYIKANEGGDIVAGGKAPAPKAERRGMFDTYNEQFLKAAGER